MPHQDAGPRIEPPVSVPIAAIASPPATAAPEPEDEPPGSCAVFQGLRAGGQGRSNDAPPIANSHVASLPRTIAPACRSSVTVAASSVGMWSLNNAEWPVVRTPAVL